MKIIFIFCFVVVTHLAGAQSASVKSLDWLVGTWERTNNKPGYMTIEHWKWDGEESLAGSGVLLKGTDTVFVEKLKIVVSNGVLNYVADVPENKSLVYFPFTAQGKTSFACENPRHDFPKKITYDLTDRSLKAVVSAGERSIVYDFKRR